jgi:hypothetical protein
MPGLVPGIHDFEAVHNMQSWMAGPSPAEAVTDERQSRCFGPRRRDKPGHDK